MATSKSKVTRAANHRDAPDTSVMPSELVEQMLAALPVTPMPKARMALVKKNLLARVAGANAAKAKIAAAGNGTSDIAVLTTRAGDGKWHSLCAGVDVQPLFDDGHTLTWFARFQPGGRLPAHDHVGPEESFVLHGSCYLGDELLNQGDRQFAADGSHHDEVFSPAGCTLLIRSASHATPHYLATLGGRAA
jgi:anti-sigma factor ChrR (cupin superfamily)